VELIKEFLEGGEGAIGLANAGGAEDNHLGEPFARDKVKGLVERVEKNLAIFVKMVNCRLA